MEGEGCPPPAKQAKLSRYGFHADGSTSTLAPTRQVLGNDSAADSDDDSVPDDVDPVAGTHDRETDESPEPRSSSSPLLRGTDGESVSSSTESAHELGKPLELLRYRVFKY